MSWLFASPPAAWLQALGTTFIGLAATWIALQNARTAKKKLNFDMFEKRLHTYRVIEQVFTAAGHFGTLTREQLSQLETEAAHARFLFSNSEIDAFLTTAVNHGHIVERYCSALANDAEISLTEDLEEFKEDRRIDLLHIDVYGEPIARPSATGGFPPSDRWVEASVWFGKNWSTWNRLTLPYLQLRR
ncbi:hypothetical protein [Achromobacter insolitus]|uniref:hypothetical protein n=1 Tax=Achromobacter insolitus TaxID=217204 RepID=UPI0028A981E8|nr:hypothetical protein [Achromobacter insolitus]